MTFFRFFLVFMYFILPSFTLKIFKVFDCLDDDALLESHGSYPRFLLREDFSIDCRSDWHFFGRLYAIAMVVIYPVGLPASYLLLLYNYREAIKGRFILQDFTAEIKLRGSNTGTYSICIALDNTNGRSIRCSTGLCFPLCLWGEVLR